MIYFYNYLYIDIFIFRNFLATNDIFLYYLYIGNYKNISFVAKKFLKIKI